MLRTPQRHANQASATAATTALPPPPTSDDAATESIATLLGQRQKPGRTRALFRVRPSARRLLWLSLGVVGVLAIAPLWAHTRGQVLSRQATVRGHLTEPGARLDGVVARVHVDVGDRVAPGQVMVELEDRSLRAALAEARADVLSLQRRLERARAVHRSQGDQIEMLRSEVQALSAAAAARVAAARLRVGDAERGLAIERELSEQSGIVAGRQVDEAMFRWRSAEAQLVEAEADRMVAQQSGEQQVRRATMARDAAAAEARVLEADLAAAQARAERAESDLADTLIRAPAEAAVIRRIAQPGAAVRSGQALVALWLTQSVWVEAWVEESEIAVLRVGQPATVTLQAYPGRRFSATVTRIGVATDLVLPVEEIAGTRARMRSTPVVAVCVELHAPPGTLVPGLSAEVAIVRWNAP